jgi:hypothetical protein
MPMWRFAFTLSLALVLFAPRGEAQCPELLQNNEFSNGTIEPWRVAISGVSDPTVEVSAQVSNDQYQNLTLTVSKTPVDGHIDLFQTVSVQQGAWYRVSFYAYSVMTHISGTVSVRNAERTQSYGLEQSFETTLTAANSTSTYTFQATASDPAAQFVIHYMANLSCCVMFDSLFMTDISSPLCPSDGGAGGISGSGGASGGGGNSGSGGRSAGTGGVAGLPGSGGVGASGGRAGSGGAATVGSSGVAGAGGTSGGGGADAAASHGSGGVMDSGGNPASGGSRSDARSSGGVTGSGGQAGIGAGGLQSGVGGDAAGGALASDAAVETGSPSQDGGAIDGASNTKPLICTPGRQVACACAGVAQQGVQVCNPQGNGYGLCTGCPAAGKAGGCSCSLAFGQAMNASPAFAGALFALILRVRGRRPSQTRVRNA